MRGEWPAGAGHLQSEAGIFRVWTQMGMLAQKSKKYPRLARDFTVEPDPKILHFFPNPPDVPRLASL